MMKSYTDLEQSKQLAEILPIESADMHYKVNRFNNESEIFTIPYSELGFYKDNDYEYCVLCWSLAALLEVLPKDIGDYRKYLYYDVGRYFCAYVGSGDLVFRLEETNADNPVDACYEMILKLHELNLL